MRGLWAAQNSSGSSHGEVSSPGDDEEVLQLKLGEPEVQIRLTRRDVRTASLKRMASIWKVLVQKIGVCLPEAGRDPNGGLAQRLAVSLLCPSSSQSLSCCMPPSMLALRFGTRQSWDCYFQQHVWGSTVTAKQTAWSQHCVQHYQ